MSEDRKSKQIFEARAQGERRRPRIEWEDYMGHIRGIKGRNLQKLKRIAKERDKFRRWLHK